MSALIAAFFKSDSGSLNIRRLDMEIKMIMVKRCQNKDWW